MIVVARNWDRHLDDVHLRGLRSLGDHFYTNRTMFLLRLCVVDHAALDNTRHLVDDEVKRQMFDFVLSQRLSEVLRRSTM